MMSVPTMERLTTCNFDLFKNTNPSHLLASDGHVYCMPIDLICINNPVDVPLDWFLALRGDTLINELKWLLGAHVTSDEWETYQHFKWGQQRICHTWQGVEYKYHGCK